MPDDFRISALRYQETGKTAARERVQMIAEALT
jgi:hypothetical protein